ncbi:hypothetical protein DPMN_125980 [Dreissena polymorpha]|uniref:Uncharacterized protein n=1 Tax=Dreissena polymorpha TaxID=45954 RepID=A0A9D4JU20_DREPO|nr:hypothetical protein DPMN_125980 [Dreissena polymorpha]
MWAGRSRIDRIVIRDIQYQFEVNRCRNDEVNFQGFCANSVGGDKLITHKKLIHSGSHLAEPGSRRQNNFLVTKIPNGQGERKGDKGVQAFIGEIHIIRKDRIFEEKHNFPLKLGIKLAREHKIWQLESEISSVKRSDVMFLDTYCEFLDGSKQRTFLEKDDDDDDINDNDVDWMMMMMMMICMQGFVYVYPDQTARMRRQVAESTGKHELERM